MLRWLNPLRGISFGDDVISPSTRITDDPLAALNSLHDRNCSRSNDIYAVSRSVLLPRVVLSSSGLNPLYLDDNGTTCLDCPKYPCKHQNDKHQTTSGRNHRRGSESPPSAGKSSGYVSQLNSRSESSHSDDPIYSRPTDIEKLDNKILEERGIVIDTGYGPTTTARNSPHLKSPDNRNKKYIGSVSSSTGFILTTIPEGKVDFTIPRPVWPGKLDGRSVEDHPKDISSSDSEDSLNIYSSLNNYVTQLHSDSVNSNHSDSRRACARDLLRDLSKTLNEVIVSKSELAPEEVLKGLNSKISQTLEILQTENDIRNLSQIISSNDKLRTVSRALSHNSIQSDDQSSPISDWERHVRGVNSDSEDVYQEPSGSSSSGFSDVSQIFKKNISCTTNEHNNNPGTTTTHPVFVHSNLSSVSNGVRNAMIYGTLCRTQQQRKDTKFKLIDNCDGNGGLRSVREISYSEKPSVWENYYGAGLTTGDFKLLAKPTDTPTFPAGRPEADFTLDVPRAELLMRRMKADKRWRCKCRIITSLLGLIFFLLTVMAVSLMLTNGKKMFGSMF